MGIGETFVRCGVDMVGLDMAIRPFWQGCIGCKLMNVRR